MENNETKNGAEDKKIIEDATNFLFFVQELSAKLPPKALHAFKQQTNVPCNDDGSDSDSNDSGFNGDISPTNTSSDSMKKEGKKFECLICGKFFKRRSSLSTHKLIHLNVKPYTCTVCNKEFLRRSDLKKHSLMHSGKKPHECPQCKKVFSQSSNMLTHMRRHTGVRPYSCGICGHAFYRKVDVRRHQQRHQKENNIIVGKTITITKQ